MKHLELSNVSPTVNFQFGDSFSQSEFYKNFWTHLYGIIMFFFKNLLPKKYLFSNILKSQPLSHKSSYESNNAIRWYFSIFTNAFRNHTQLISSILITMQNYVPTRKWWYISFRESWRSGDVASIRYIQHNREHFLTKHFSITITRSVYLIVIIFSQNSKYKKN